MPKPLLRLRGARELLVLNTPMVLDIIAPVGCVFDLHGGGGREGLLGGGG